MLSHRSAQPMLATFLSVLISLVIFLAPSNLFYRLDQFDWAVRGLRIDYLLGKLYLSDILLVMLVPGLLLANKKITFEFQKIWFVGVLTLALLVRQIFTDFPIAGFSQLFRLLLLFLAAWLIKKNWSQLNLSWLWLTLAASNFFQSIISLWQFLTQHSVGNYYWLLGEANLSQSFGLARGSFGNWGEKILPYGTTAHPNILAAWLVSSWLLLLVLWPKVILSKPLKILIILLAGIGAVWGIVATQSVTALGLFLHGIGYFLIKNFWPKIKLHIIKFGFLVLVASVLLSPLLASAIIATLPESLQKSPSISRRIYLQTAAEKIFTTQPIFGVGVQQFTANLEVMQRSLEPVRFDQPVHHVLWLWLAETGLLGIIWVISLYHTSENKLKNLKKILTLGWLLFPSLIWDHYLLTQPTGLLIIWLWWVFKDSELWSKSASASGQRLVQE